MNAHDYVLSMDEIKKSFPGVLALNNVSFKVRAGSVHALMGENGAGKSTLMKCLFGLYKPDSGSIFIDGHKKNISTTTEALELGIAMIHQELHPIPHRSIMENIWLGRYPVKSLGCLVDTQKMYFDTQCLFDEMHIKLNPATWVSELSVSQIQLMEIVKAVSYNAKIIIMDEPTSSLTQNEVEVLFEIINKLRNNGVAIIYISHKMDEILKISDDVTIMRDGALIGTYKASTLNIDDIIKHMVGRELKERFPIRTNKPTDVILSVSCLTSVNPKSFKNVSFDLKKGEILGFGGLVGAQRTELVEALFGLRPIKSGQIHLHSKPVKIDSPMFAIKNKMALLTEERRATGIFPMLSVLDNVLISNLTRFVKKTGFLNLRHAQQKIGESIKQLRVKTPSLKTLIQNLSGGNQQKVILSRWLLTEPDILILDEPTRGIDVGAKFEIYSIISTLAQAGKSIIIVSSELSELLGITDRIAVMCEGKITGILNTNNASQEQIMHLATQFPPGDNNDKSTEL